MKRIVMFMMVAVLMLVSLGGCFWGYEGHGGGGHGGGGHDRDGGHGGGGGGRNGGGGNH
ncbi:MAG TPA: hypothetical protein VGJ94_18345 [Syntrophorhabdaceae bacterium]